MQVIHNPLVGAITPYLHPLPLSLPPKPLLLALPPPEPTAPPPPPPPRAPLLSSPLRLLLSFLIGFGTAVRPRFYPLCGDDCCTCARALPTSFHSASTRACDSI